MSKQTNEIIDKFIRNCRNSSAFRDSIVPNEDGQRTYYIAKSFGEIRDEIIEEQFKHICKAFQLDDTDKHISDLFHAAACGSGNEWMEINQLNSSSLLSFLCFHRVSSERHITINGEEYDRVMFEVKSPLEKSSAPSNMDVVLLNDNTVLFLESKFSEYLTSKNVKVSTYYNKYYDDVFDGNFEFKGFRFKKQDQTWKADGDGAYMEGIKQMISHYLGLRYSSKDRCKWCGGKFKDKKIKLAEIVYRFESEQKPVKEFNNYNYTSAQLFSRLKKDSMNNGIDVFESILTYQDVFSEPMNAFLLPDRVKEFYNLGYH